MALLNIEYLVQIRISLRESFWSPVTMVLLNINCVLVHYHYMLHCIYILHYIRSDWVSWEPPGMKIQFTIWRSMNLVATYPGGGPATHELMTQQWTCDTSLLHSPETDHPPQHLTRHGHREPRTSSYSLSSLGILQLLQ